MLIQEKLSIEEKLKILTDAAKYDVACTSSGVERGKKKGSLGNTSQAGICHSFSADGRCISLLKILFTNQCIYDCRYCINRRTNDTLRTSFTPEEICKLTLEFYRRNYIEGLFLSSGILNTPDDTMEQLYETLRLLRIEYHFNGYIHVKMIPGAHPDLIEKTGFLADRMSVNLELPTSDGLKQLAPGKTREKILLPMRQVQKKIAWQIGEEKFLKNKGLSESYGFHETGIETVGKSNSNLILPERLGGLKRKTVIPERSIYGNYGISRVSNKKRYFVPAGQSTQMIVGATPESDYQMLSVAEALYKNFGLKRVFYSAFIPVNQDSLLPSLPGGPPLLREHRLYQADWLLRYYGFQASELLSETKQNFNILLDPKCDWAIQNLEQFPIEINKGSYEMLLRVPGIGVKSAMRIIRARREAALKFEDLKKLGVVLKRAVYFITCSGKTMHSFRMTEDFITNRLIGDEGRRAWELEHRGLYRQLSLFDDFHLQSNIPADEKISLITGEF